MAGINSLGIGSGVLTADVLDQLREADNAVILKPLEDKLELSTQKEDAYKLLDGYMDAFKQSTSSLGGENLYLGRQSTGSDEFVTVTSKPGADLQSFNITDVVKAEKDVWNSDSVFSSTSSAIGSTGSGTLTINVGGEDLEIEYNALTTLDDIRLAINESLTFGATATNLKIGEDKYTFSLTADDFNEAITFTDTQEQEQIDKITLDGNAKTGDVFTWSDGTRSIDITLVDGETAEETGARIADAINLDAGGDLAGLYVATATSDGFTIKLVDADPNNPSGDKFTSTASIAGPSTELTAIKETVSDGYTRQLDTISLSKDGVTTNTSHIAQVSTQKITIPFTDTAITDGTLVAGNTISGNFDGVAYSYTVQASDIDAASTNDELMANVASQMQTDLASIASSVTWDEVNQEMVVTALTPGTPFSSATPTMTMNYSGNGIQSMGSTNTGSTSDTANVVAVAQVNTQKISNLFSNELITGGTFGAGHTISGTYDGTAYSYTIQASDVDAGSTSDELMTNIAAQMQTDLAAIASSVTWDVGNQEMVVTALTPGTPFSSATPTMTMNYSGGAVNMGLSDAGSTADTANAQAVAQISTQTFTNLFTDNELTTSTGVTVNDTISGSFAGTAYSYTVQATDLDAGSTNDELMANIAAQMQTDLAAIASSVTWDVGNQEMVVTALTPGTAFANTTFTMAASGAKGDLGATDVGSSTDTANATAVAQISTQKATTLFSNTSLTDGTITAGQTISGTFDGTAYSYTIQASDVDAGSTSDDLMTNIAAQMQTDLAAIASSVTWDVGNQEMVVTALTPGTGFSSATPTFNMTYSGVAGSSMDPTNVGSTADTANVVAVAQVNTQTFTDLFTDTEITDRTVVAGQTISGSFDGVAYSYTIQAADVDAGSTSNDLMTNIAAQMQTDLSSIASTVTWDSVNQEMVITAKTAGTPFSSTTPNLTMNYSGGAVNMDPTDVSSTADTANYTSGAVAEAGDEFTWSDNDGNTITVALVAGEDAALSGIRIAEAINNDATLSALYTAVATDDGFTIESNTFGTTFTTSTSTTGALEAESSITRNAKSSLFDQLQLNNIQEARGSSFKYNGIEITRSDNTIDDLLNGVTISLTKNHGLGDSTSINVTQNDDTIKTEMELFVTNYNTLASNLKDMTLYDQDKEVAGIFNSETFIKSISSQLKSIISGSDTEGNSLFSYGISLDKDGVMSLDSAAFSAKLSEDSAALEELFRGASATTTLYKQQNTITLTGTAGATETFTWDDGSNGVTVDIANLSPLQAGLKIATAINDDPVLKNLYYAVGNDTGFTIEARTAGVAFSGNSVSTGTQSSREITTQVAFTTADDEKIGIFQQLDIKMNSFTSSSGLLSNFNEKLSNEKSSTISEYDKQKANLDARYETMTKKFAAYDAIINKMNNQFASLKSMIEAQYNNDN